MAVAHSILGIVYSMLRDGSAYQDLAENYFDERDRQGAIRRAVRRMERLGFKVTLVAA